MKILIAPDSFKGNLSSLQVAAALETGVRRVLPRARCLKLPVADGGEGTVQSLLDALGGSLVRKQVCGPAGRPVRACYGLLADGESAVIEAAEASGLPLVSGRERNPLRTTSYGTGELLRAALDRGVRHIIIGIGGTATSDGGAGVAQALGARFYSAAGRELRRPATGGMLERITRIATDAMHPGLRRCRVTVACDVKNPLCGPHGAARVYGPQKGATPKAVATLDRNLACFGRLIERDLQCKVLTVPGAGAGGGLGAGLLAFCGARLRPGVRIVLQAVHFRRHLQDADLVITGEGRIDAQTPFGKTPAGVASAARASGVPVIAIGGALADDAGTVFKHGINGLESAAARDMDLAEALRHSRDHLANAAERALRLLGIGQRMERRRQRASR